MMVSFYILLKGYFVNVLMVNFEPRSARGEKEEFIFEGVLLLQAFRAMVITQRV